MDKEKLEVKIKSIGEWIAIIWIILMIGLVGLTSMLFVVWLIKLLLGGIL